MMSEKEVLKHIVNNNGSCFMLDCNNCPYYTKIEEESTCKIINKIHSAWDEDILKEAINIYVTLYGESDLMELLL